MRTVTLTEGEAKQLTEAIRRIRNGGYQYYGKTLLAGLESIGEKVQAAKEEKA